VDAATIAAGLVDGDLIEGIEVEVENFRVYLN
jgi:hypothetical protein